jgi:hypothetical protein
VVEPKLLLELLVGLFTDPPGLDRGSERLDGGIVRQVRHIVFLLPGRPPLADEPDLVARHALHTVVKHPVLMAIRNADMAGREETCQPTFGAPPRGGAGLSNPNRHHPNMAAITTTLIEPQMTAEAPTKRQISAAAPTRRKRIGWTGLVSLARVDANSAACREHQGLALLIRTLPETVAGTTGQREYELQDSQNTHDLIS